MTSTAVALLALALATPPEPRERPLPAPLALAEAIEPGGGKVALSAAVEAVVDPSCAFRVVLPGRSEDARLSLLDAADALIPATGTREVGEQTVLGVTPRQPLVPASRYVLRIEGATGRDLHDDAGRPAAPVEIHLVAAGSAPEPPRKAPRRRRR